MGNKTFNFGGTEQEYQLAQQTHGNMSEFITEAILSRLNTKENPLVVFYQEKLSKNLSALEDIKIKIGIIEQENEHILAQIRRAKQESQAEREKQAIQWAKSKEKEIKSSIDMEYNYIKKMKEYAWEGTLHEFLIKEYLEQ
jgi:hypothetical protein